VMEQQHEHTWPKGELRPQLHGRIWTADGRIWNVTAVYINADLEVYAYDLECRNEKKEEVTKEQMAKAVRNKKARCLGLDTDKWNSLR